MALTMEEKQESEGFHNQPITAEAAARMQARAAREGKKKALVLQLDEREQLALAFLGGGKALRHLLAPTGLCLRCRIAQAVTDSPFGSLCAPCALATEPQA